MNKEIKTLSSINSFLIDGRGIYEVEIGDTKRPEVFYPQVKVKCWNNQSNFSIRLKSEVDNSIYLLENDRILWKDSARDTEVHIYEHLEDNLEDSALEFEVVFNRRPSTNEVIFTLETKNLELLFQPEVTEQEVEEFYDSYKKAFERELPRNEETIDYIKKFIRPENLINSFAVYAKTLEIPENYSGFVNLSGKLFHIFRPKIRDSENKSCWCDFSPDLKDNLLKIIIPQEFLDKAVYPIFLDPTIGYTSSIGSYSGYIATNTAVAVRAVAVATGRVTELYAYVYSGSISVAHPYKGVIWNATSPYSIIYGGVANQLGYSGYDTYVGGTKDDPGSLVSVAPTKADWSSSVYKPWIVNTVAYYVGYVVGGYPCYYRYDSGTSGSGVEQSNSFAVPTALSSTFTNRRPHVYAYFDYGSSSSSSCRSSSSSSSSSSSCRSSSSSSSSSSKSSSSKSSSSSFNPESISSSSSSFSSSSSSSSSSSISSSSFSFSLSVSSSSSSRSSSSSSWSQLPGTITWGHASEVEEFYRRKFINNWQINDTTYIEFSEDADKERLILSAYYGGQAISESWYIRYSGGSVFPVILTYNKYRLGYGLPIIYYKTGSTRVECEESQWIPYEGIAECRGWLKVMLIKGPSSSSSSSRSVSSSSSSSSSSSEAGGTIVWGNVEGTGGLPSQLFTLDLEQYGFPPTVEESYVRSFSGNWTYENATVKNEVLVFGSPSYAVSEIWKTGVGEFHVFRNKYGSGYLIPTLKIQYRTASTPQELQQIGWTDLDGGKNFYSLGYAQIRILINS